MPTIKPELSKKNKYWIPKHRYYELKHYCLQYPRWWKLYNSLEIKMAEHSGIRAGELGNPTEKLALIRAECKKAMELVERCASEAFPELGKALLLGVTEGWSYDILQARVQLPCSKDMYYEHYRKFFYILSQRRGI